MMEMMFYNIEDWGKEFQLLKSFRLFSGIVEWGGGLGSIVNGV